MIDNIWEIEVREAEKRLLSSIVHYYPQVSEEISDSFLDDSHFFSEAARRLWQAIQITPIQQGKYDPVLIINSLRSCCVSENDLEMSCGYLNGLETDIYYFAIQDYIQILKYNKMRMSLHNLARAILSEKRGYKEFEGLLDEWKQAFDEVMVSNNVCNYIDAKQVVKEHDEWLENLKINPNPAFLKTGFEHLDSKIKHLGGGQLIVLASRPGVGKTTFALNIIFNNTQKLTYDPKKEKQTALGIFSLEMTNKSLLNKLLALTSKVDLLQLQKLTDGEPISPIDDKLIKVAKDRFKILNILFSDEPGMTIGKMGALIRSWVKKFDLKLVIVDYLQLVDVPSVKTKDNFNNYHKIGIISRTLKIIAMDLNICILALAQLNRKSEERRGTDKSPILSDLRESGSIEQDADVVMFLYEDKEEHEESDPNTEEVKKFDKYFTMLKIAKNRHGPTGKVKFIFDKKQGEYKLAY